MNDEPIYSMLSGKNICSGELNMVYNRTEDGTDIFVASSNSCSAACLPTFGSWDTFEAAGSPNGTTNNFSIPCCAVALLDCGGMPISCSQEGVEGGCP